MLSRCVAPPWNQERSISSRSRTGSIRRCPSACSSDQTRTFALSLRPVRATFRLRCARDRSNTRQSASSAWSTHALGRIGECRVPLRFCFRPSVAVEKLRSLRPGPPFSEPRRDAAKTRPFADDTALADRLPPITERLTRTAAHAAERCWSTCSLATNSRRRAALRRQAKKSRLCRRLIV